MAVIKVTIITVYVAIKQPLICTAININFPGTANLFCHQTAVIVIFNECLCIVIVMNNNLYNINKTSFTKYKLIVKYIIIIIQESIQNAMSNINLKLILSLI